MDRKRESKSSVPMYYTSFFVEVSNSLGNLDDDVPRELFGKVGEFDDLMEEFSSWHKSEMKEGKREQVASVSQLGELETRNEETYSRVRK